MSVTNREIYTSALSLIGETANNENIADYEERAPYLIASFCSSNTSLDKKIRKAEDLSNAARFSPIYLSLERDFPLCDILASAAALYTASMLTIDEDDDLSDSLYDKYCDTMASLNASYSAEEQRIVIVPEPESTPAPIANLESIKDVYFFD